MTFLRFALPTVLATLSLQSCASIMTRPQAVTVTSEPPGMPFRTNYGTRGVTPATIMPPLQNQDLRVVFELEQGRLHSEIVHHRLSHWWWGNVVFGPLGLITAAVEMGSSRAYVLDGDSVHYTSPQSRND